MTETCKNEIKLIVKPSTTDTGASTKDRMGGEVHGVVNRITGLVSKQVDVSKVSADASEAALKSAALFQQALSKSVGDFSIEEFTISLAVTAEGNIGIATSGVEGSISIVFKRREASS